MTTGNMPGLRKNRATYYYFSLCVVFLLAEFLVSRPFFYTIIIRPTLTVALSTAMSLFSRITAVQAYLMQ